MSSSQAYLKPNKNNKKKYVEKHIKKFKCILISKSFKFV